MTYNDYISAVYGYEDALQAEQDAAAAAIQMKKKRTAIIAAIEKYEQRAAANRAEHDKLLTEEIGRKKDSWQASAAKLDYKISIEIANEKQSARIEIENHRDRYDHVVKETEQRVKKDVLRMKELDAAYERLSRYNSRFDDYEGVSAPPYSEDVVDTMQRAMDKHLLTKYQREMTELDADSACRGWLTGFPALETAEKELAESEFYEKIVKGEVTPEVFEKTAVISSYAFFGLLVLMSIILAAAKPVILLRIFGIIVLSFGLGALLASLMHEARNRFDVIKRLRLKSHFLAIAAFAVGVVPGIFIGIALPVLNSFMPLFLLLAAGSVCSSMLLRRGLRTSFVHDLLSDVPFLRDCARKQIFQEYEGLEDGKYNFMIYCSLNHDACLQYVSIKYADSEKKRISHEMSVNRKTYAYYENELLNDSDELDALKTTDEPAEFEKKRNAQLAERIKVLEAKRPLCPDFTEKAEESIKDKLEPLDEEYGRITGILTEAKKKFKPFEEKFRQRVQTYRDSHERLEIIKNALRDWDQTPVPAATGYKLVGMLCTDNGDTPMIVEHKLKPIVVEYAAAKFRRNPSETLCNTIYEYIRGLCRINPKRLIQINIFDYVSDARFLLRTDVFDGMTKRGIGCGVHNMKSFEVRLFFNESGLDTFCEIQAGRKAAMDEVFRMNESRIKEGAKRTVSLANRLAADTDIFLYQVCIIVVPREGEGGQFPLPTDLFDVIKNSGSGILPIFFADKNSIAQEWEPIISALPHCSQVISING